MQKSSVKNILIGIILVSVTLRVIAAVYLGQEVAVLPGAFDQFSYHNLAIRVLEGYGFTFGVIWWPLTAAGAPTAHWSYLYTGYLVGVYSIVGVSPIIARVIQAILVGILHPYLIFRIGKLAFGEKVGLITAAITAIYAYFIYYSATLMTESFYITAILAAFLFAFLLSQKDVDEKSTWLAVGLGISLGITVLFRQLFLLFIPFLFLWLWYTSYRKTHSLPFRQTIIAGGILVVMIIPFTIFNYAQFDRFVLLNTNAGFAFYWGNHPSFGTHIVPAREFSSYQDLIPDDLKSLDEAALDSALLKLGIQNVIDDPVRFLLLSLSRVPEYFRVLPDPDSELMSNISRIASFGLFLPFMLIGLWGWTRDLETRKLSDVLESPAGLLILFSIFYTVIHIFIWALIRYRLPVDAVMLLFAGYSLKKIAEWFLQNFKKQQTFKHIH